MVGKYNHKEIESKWQAEWEKAGLYVASDDSSKPKCYVLDMFPYPSGEGLHVGHPKGYIATDVYSRMKKMQGFNVLHPMGWDAFGLPAEQYAIKNKVHPRVAVDKNTTHFKEQLSIIGFNYDWTREVNTTDPEFYKWTQWIFLKMFEKGLAYESYEPINWCPTCQTGLANEDLEDGACERCDTPVEKKPMRQWVLRITQYADRMLEDLDALDWPTSIKESQKNWIGRSEGAEIDFKIEGSDKIITVFTTRPDTLFGATYVVLAPENKLIDELASNITNMSDVLAYREEAKGRTEIERTAEGREKTGVKLEGVFAINPANNEKLPVFAADYVLGNYGTGAVMAVPAHDERDFEFAKKFNLEMKKVVEPITGVKKENEEFRRSIVALVEDPKTGKILSLNWGEMGGNLLIGGGLDHEEDIVTCAKREIGEETGYKHLEFVAQTEKIHHHYVAISKGVNREIEAVGLYFKLLSDEKSETALEENEIGKFKVEWLSRVELGGLIKDPLHRLVFERFVNNKIYTDDGILSASGGFDGIESNEAKRKITDFVNGRWVTKYRLKDWVFSRQRYWGEPIPLIHCDKCGVVPVPESELPVLLPQVESYAPTGTGESPLADIAEWVNTTCPTCGGAAKRETNTMPQWAGSSWYYLRYIDPKNSEALVDKAKEKYWSPVDMYVGGAEHATRHLIYARFYHKFLYDIGVVNYTEPFNRLQNVGLIMAEDGRKMSKRWGNVVNPDDVVNEYGADTLRLYEMFMGPFNQSVAWSTQSIVGPNRFLERVWKLSERISNGADEKATDVSIHKTIKKVSDDIEKFGFNTAISALMILVNDLEKAPAFSKSAYETLLKLLAPFAPHITEELWNELGNVESIHLAEWPAFDASKCVESEVTIAIQVNGKLRETMVVAMDTDEEEIKTKALAMPNIVKWTEGKEIRKVIVVKGKLVSVVVGE